MNSSCVCIQEITIPDMMRHALDSMKDCYCIVNAESRILYANLSFAKLAGFSTPDGLNGKFYHEVQSTLFEKEEDRFQWEMQDREVMTNPSRPLSMLEIHPNAVFSPYTVDKYPLYDNNKIVGTIHNHKYVEILKPNDFLKGRKPGSLLLNRPDDVFSEKECEIIFLKLQGMTSKKIGDFLSLSSRTVENRLQRIYIKCGVNHADDFAAYCEKRNYDRYLPGRFLDPQQVLF